MKVYNNKNHFVLSKNILKTLNFLRNKRNFNAKDYVYYKAKILNNYMNQHNLSCCVIAISGGIDSAIVLGIVKHASKQKNSPIKKIIPVCMPALTSDGGVINQQAATNKGLNLISNLNLTRYCVDLSSGYKSLKSTIELNMNLIGKDWANGQFIPYLRTASLYYITALQTQEGFKSIIVGTTNKDEGAYLGYFGKASDGMVDVQLISDIHKSEVFLVAKYLAIPEEIISAIPSGDMFDGRNDEDVFGASYDFVELFLKYKKLENSIIKLTQKKWNKKDYQQYLFLADKLENMHKYNLHKYIGCSPAVHLDLFDSFFEGGWKTNQSYNQKKDKDYSKFNGFFNINQDIFKELTFNRNSIENYKDVFKAKVINKKIVKLLQNECKKQNGTKVDYTGYKNNPNQVGSYRMTFESRILSEFLYLQLENIIPRFLEKDNKIYSFNGVADIFRVIQYDAKGLLYPHFDHPYDFNETKTTIKSLVIYLTPVNVKNKGRTRFIKNNKKDNKDWTRIPKENEIELMLDCDTGECIAFNHEHFHDSEPTLNKKIIIRTDLIYNKLC